VNEKTGNATDGFGRWGNGYPAYYEVGTRLEGEFRLSHNLVLAARRWTSLIDNLLRTRTGQSRARWETLFAIAFCNRPITTVALAEHMGTSWPTLIRVLNSLEEDGLLTRVDNPNDGRSRLIELTEEGKAMTHRIQPILDEARRTMLEGLSDEEVAIGIDLLARMRKAVEQSS